MPGAALRARTALLFLRARVSGCSRVEVPGFSAQSTQKWLVPSLPVSLDLFSLHTGQTAVFPEL